MSRDAVILERTVAEALRRAKLLFAPRRGNQSSTGNASSTQAGLVPPVPADATKFLNGAAPPAYAQVKGSDLAMSDVTANNVTIAQHGFTPKLPNDATKYLDGTGVYSVPPGTSSGGGGPALGTFPAITGLQLRLSAELSTMTLNTDGRVAQINDMSGTWGANFTAAGSARPRLLLRGMGYYGRPCLAFDGVNTQLLAAATKTLAQPFTMIAVFQNYKGGGANQIVMRDQSSGAALFNNGGSAWALFAGSTVSSATLYTQNTENIPDGMTAAPAVMMGVFNGASSIIANNGVEVTLSPGATGISGTMGVGKDGSGVARMLLYEVLIFNKALNSTERGQLNTYYAAALGITL